jgi:tetratricopeptide (TPR) repeat protein
MLSSLFFATTAAIAQPAAVKRVDGSQAIDEIIRLRTSVHSLRRQNDYAKAEVAAEQAAALAERHLDHSTPLYAMVLDDFANILEKQGKLDQAVSTKLRSYEVWQKLADKNDAEPGEKVFIAEGLCLFDIFAQRNHLPIPAKLPMQVFQIIQNAPDWNPDSESVLLSMSSMLLWPEHKAEAKVSARRWVKVSVEAEDKTQYPGALSWVAKMAAIDCDFTTQRDFAERAIDAELACPQRNTRRLKQDLELLAQAHEGSNDFAAAASILEKILQMIDPTDYQEIFFLKDELCGLYCFLHDLEKAKRYGTESEQIASTQFGKLSDEYASTQSLLGWVAFLQGNLPEARQRLLSTIQHFSNNSQLVYGCYAQLARIDAKNGDWAAATAHSIKAADAFCDNFRKNKSGFLLAEQIAQVKDQVRPILRGLINCAHHSHPGSVYSRVFPLKGLVFDNLSLYSQVSRYCKTTPKAMERLKQCTTNERNLAQFRLQPAMSSPVREMLTLTEKDESLRRELLAESISWASKSQDVKQSISDTAALRQSLSNEECFVDVYKFVPFDHGKAAYCAFVLSKHNEPKTIDIDAADLEESISAWLKCIRRGTTMTVAKLDSTNRDIKLDTMNVDYGAGELSEIQRRSEVAKKLKTLLEEIKPFGTCFASLDGDLYKVPWRLLLRKNQQFAEIDSVSQLSVKRGSQKKPADSDEVLVVSDVRYDHAPKLAATKSEGKAIRALADLQKFHVTQLVQSAADRESVIEALAKCTYAHIATHGYFIDQSPTDNEQWITYFASRNALMESGILTAQDQPLTAQDFVSIELSRCKHVTLSACDTGVGETTFTGEGIVGLRSAIAAAGTRSLLVSLWPVDDDSTAELMNLFYINLWEKHYKPTAALAQAQETLVTLHPEWANPYFWAGWIIVGRN